MDASSVLSNEKTSIQAINDRIGFLLEYALSQNWIQKDANFTLFIPRTILSLNLHSAHVAKSFWNRHFMMRRLNIQREHGLLTIRTSNNLYYPIYKQEQEIYISSAQIQELNQTIMQCPNGIYHIISHELPIIYFDECNFIKFPLVVCSEDTHTLQIDHECLNIAEMKEHNPFVQIVFAKFANRNIVNTNIQPLDETGLIHVSIPFVLEEEKMSFWMQIMSNRLKMPLVSWLRPQNMEIHPNLLLKTQPTVWDINPTKGYENQSLWIHGNGFIPGITRVIIGNRFAVVFFATTDLIKCFVPKMDDIEKQRKCIVQVVNGQLYTSCKLSFVCM